MFSHILEAILNEQLPDGITSVKVFNLAIAGHEATSITQVLRIFGHMVKPDLILAYVGANDTYQLMGSGVLENRSCKSQYDELIRKTYVFPDELGALVNLFPAIMLKYGGLSFIKSKFYSADYRLAAKEKCYGMLGLDPKSNDAVSKQIFYNISRPVFIDSFKSIKRDFCGLPIMIAWQAIHYGERLIYNNLTGNKITSEHRVGDGNDVYQEFYKFIKPRLAGYYNSDWFFLDADRILNSDDYGDLVVNNKVSIHLHDEAHEALGSLLAERLRPALSKKNITEYRRKSGKLCPGLH